MTGNFCQNLYLLIQYKGYAANQAALLHLHAKKQILSMPQTMAVFFAKSISATNYLIDLNLIISQNISIININFYILVPFAKKIAHV